MIVSELHMIKKFKFMFTNFFLPRLKMPLESKHSEEISLPENKSVEGKI